MDDLFDLMQDDRLTLILSHQLSEALFGEVGSDTRMTPIGPKGGQHPFGQLEDLEDSCNPGMVLFESPGQGADALEALMRHHQAIAPGALPGWFLTHPVLVGLPSAGPDAALAVQFGRRLATQKLPAAVLVDDEVLIMVNDVGRLLAGLFHVGVPDQGSQADSS